MTNNPLPSGVEREAEIAVAAAAIMDVFCGGRSWRPKPGEPIPFEGDVYEGDYVFDKPVSRSSVAEWIGARSPSAFQPPVLGWAPRR